MIDTRLCETEQDLKDAMNYERLKNKITELESGISTLTASITRLQSMRTQKLSKLSECKSEIEKLSDKPWIVHHTKG